MPKFTPLKEMILRRRIVQADLAEEAYITESRLSRIVNSRVKPTTYERKHIARVLGVTTEELPV